jgi:RNA polymerase sigma-70 factor (ECF subfamily)
MISAMRMGMANAGASPPVDATGFLADESTRLATLAVAILGDLSDAEDAVQETLTAAWRSWSSVRDEDKRHAWLTTICIRQCLRTRRLRIGRRTTQLREQIPDVRVPSDIHWDRAFSELSARQRAVIVLHYFYGYTLDECAELIGRRPGTARRHLARGLAHLRREMVDE